MNKNFIYTIFFFNLAGVLKSFWPTHVPVTSDKALPTQTNQNQASNPPHSQLLEEQQWSCSCFGLNSEAPSSQFFLLLGVTPCLTEHAGEPHSSASCPSIPQGIFTPTPHFCLLLRDSQGSLTRKARKERSHPKKPWPHTLTRGPSREHHNVLAARWNFSRQLPSGSALLSPALLLESCALCQGRAVHMESVCSQTPPAHSNQF